MKKIFKYALALIVVVLLVETFVYLFRKSRPDKTVWSEVAPAVMDIEKTTMVTGTIVPRDEVDIKPQINGIIAELLKQPGESVKEGDVIARLTVIPDMSSLSAAQSRVRLAEINLKQARVNYDREKELYDKKLVSAEEYETEKQALDQAKEELVAANDALEVIRDGVSSSNANSSSTLVRSTVSGLILDIPVKVGNSVIQANTMNEGTTVATVADMNDLIFDGKIDETEVGRLEEGMQLKITVGALQDLRFDAVLEYISPKAEESNGTNMFEIKAAVSVPAEARIRSGYSANAEIVLQSVYQVLTLPESTIEFEGDLSYVYKLAEDGYAREAVELGLSDGLNVEIRSGISGEDKVRGAQI